MLLFMHVSVPEYIQDVPQPPTDQREFLTLMEILQFSVHIFRLNIYSVRQTVFHMTSASARTYLCTFVHFSSD